MQICYPYIASRASRQTGIILGVGSHVLQHSFGIGFIRVEQVTHHRRKLAFVPLLLPEDRVKISIGVCQQLGPFENFNGNVCLLFVLEFFALRVEYVDDGVPQLKFFGRRCADPHTAADRRLCGRLEAVGGQRPGRDLVTSDCLTHVGHAADLRSGEWVDRVVARERTGGQAKRFPPTDEHPEEPSITSRIVRFELAKVLRTRDHLGVDLVGAQERRLVAEATVQLHQRAVGRRVDSRNGHGASGQLCVWNQPREVVRVQHTALGTLD